LRYEKKIHSASFPGAPAFAGGVYKNPANFSKETEGPCKEKRKVSKAPEGRASACDDKVGIVGERQLKNTGDEPMKHLLENLFLVLFMRGKKRRTVGKLRSVRKRRVYIRALMMDMP
jgi:hypothetical protein